MTPDGKGGWVWLSKNPQYESETIEKTQAPCPYCGQLSPYGVRIREQEWEREIRLAKLIDTAVEMLRFIERVEQTAYEDFKESLERLGVEVDD